MQYRDDDQGRPVVGICAAVTDARWGVWHQRAALLPLAYIKHIQQADGIALMLPPDSGFESSPDEVLQLLDGLILAGGTDIDPCEYDTDRHPETGRSVPERDHAELALARRAVDLDMPVLGICRGMQVMNVAFGGTLVQHLPDELGHESHRPTPGSFEKSDHAVRLVEGSLAAAATGELLHDCKTHHHQGLDQLGTGLVATAWAEDGMVEAAELDAPFVLGVQWHPEAGADPALFRALVLSAAQRRG